MSEDTKRLALIGYGKMGRLIDQLAPQHGFEVVDRLDSKSSPRLFQDIDVAIEFTTPDAVLGNVKSLAEASIPVVSGTTGWFAQLDEVTNIVRQHNTGLVWSPNFSIGVAVFRKIVAGAAELLENEDEYGAWAWEIHHDAKKDAPSGTLLDLVRTMVEHGYTRNIDVSANRAGRHPGTHEIGFDSSADTITLRHVARSREGFAHGALKAARWILGRAGVYTFNDVLFGTTDESK